MAAVRNIIGAVLLLVVATQTTEAFTSALSRRRLVAGERQHTSAPKRARRAGGAAAATTTMLGWSPLGALRSPAGKLTFSTEISSRGVSAVPSDEVEELSRLCRHYAKAAAVVVRDAAMLEGVVKEQQTVMGDFPGPCPVVYRPVPSPLESASATVQTAVLHGAAAVAVQVPAGASVQKLTEVAESAKTLGVTVIPEFEDGGAADSERVREVALAAAGGSAKATKFAFIGSHGGADAVPELSPEVRKEVACVGVVDALGQDLLKATVKDLEAKGLAGAIITSECVPQRLGVVDSGKYFAAALSDLRSTASETFRVRLQAFTSEGSGAPDEWAKYYQMATETGITGQDQLKGDEEEGEGFETPAMRGEDATKKDRKFDPDQGDYKGFA